MQEILDSTAHRPYSLPKGPWIMSQRWHDLLFAHWPVAAYQVSPLLPSPLRPFLDVFDGRAWVGVIPFWMSSVKFRGIPAIPGLSSFAEMNCRTYVTVGGKPGVYFFSLDAESLSAVYGARLGFALHYFYARMSVVGKGGPMIHYSSKRLQSPKPAELQGSYGPRSEIFHAVAGSIEHFLTERYCLYTVRGGRIWRGDIHHLPWPLQRAQAEIRTNSVAQSHGIELPATEPLLHFARELDVLIWPPARCK
jgi:uncharacterized protein YqjF (DUF2071 family)